MNEKEIIEAKDFAKELLGATLAILEKKDGQLSLDQIVVAFNSVKGAFIRRQIIKTQRYV